MIPPETRAEIRRLFYAEHFTVHAIAEVLGVHHSTVTHAIESSRFDSRSLQRRSMLDPYQPFIADTLQRYPKLRATRLHQMLEDRGYRGSVQQLRRVVRALRPRPTPAFLALSFLPGEQAQIDWGSFGTLRVGRALRKLSCFLMVLSFSRRIFARFTLDQTLESFLRCHVEGFHYFGGIPRQGLYDNLKSVVLERIADVVRFHPAILEFAGHYHFRPVPCNKAAGWEKGRVEAGVRYLRSSFAGARTYRDLDDANRQLRRWLDEVANVRPWPDDRTRTVEHAFAEEQDKLLPLPEHDIEPVHQRPVRARKQPYVHFDLNRYSVPHTATGRPLILAADEHTVRVLEGTAELARHVRSYDRGERVEDPAHIAGLLEAKRRGRLPTATDRLVRAIPELREILDRLARRGDNLGSNVSRLARLVDEHGSDLLRIAVHEALERDTPTATAIGSLLYQRLRAANLPPTLPVQLPDDPRVRGLRVVSHDPASYDVLAPPRAVPPQTDPEPDDA